MTDTIALRSRIKASGYRLGYIAEWLGISTYTLQRKIDNNSEFRVSEVDAMSKLLNMTPAEKDAYFFASKVDCKSTFEEANRLTAQPQAGQDSA